jgi:hypothetical protein
MSSLMNFWFLLSRWSGLSGRLNDSFHMCLTITATQPSQSFFQPRDKKTDQKVEFLDWSQDLPQGLRPGSFLIDRRRFCAFFHKPGRKSYGNLHAAEGGGATFYSNLTPKAE